MELKIKRVIALFLGIISILFLAGCYDLGSFEDTDDYYGSFSDATFYDIDYSKTSYEIKKYLYNEDTQNNFNKDDNDITFISTDNYSYMALQAKRDMTIGAVAFFINAKTSVGFNIEIYIVDNYDKSDFSEYDDTEKSEDDVKNPISDKATTTVASDWIYVEFNVNTNISSGHYILVKFVNNTYDGKQLGLSKVEFKLVNLLIRAVF